MKENNKDNKLPRGIADLIRENQVDDILDGEQIEEIELSVIRPNPYQPRRFFDKEKISELAKSIKEHGVFTPIIVKKAKDGYMLVSGERRLRAAKEAGLLVIPAVVRQYEESKVAEIALAENLQRENLSPIEEAEGYQIIMNSLGLTQSELAERVGKSRSHVTNILGLLKLPINVQNLLLEHNVSMGHARVLSKLDDDAKIYELAKLIIEKNISVRKLEELTKNEEKTNKINRKGIIRDMEEYRLSFHLGTKVSIKGKNIIISFKDEKELDDIIKKIINLWNMK